MCRRNRVSTTYAEGRSSGSVRCRIRRCCLGGRTVCPCPAAIDSYGCPSHVGRLSDDGCATSKSPGRKLRSLTLRPLRCPRRSMTHSSERGARPAFAYAGEGPCNAHHDDLDWIAVVDVEPA